MEIEGPLHESRQGARPGNYEPGVALEKAVSPPLDLSRVATLELGFARWLGVDRADRAALEVSTNGGVRYAPVWQSPTTTDVCDRLWRATADS